MPTTGNRKGNRANLKPFKKGQSGNPNGRPKIPRSVIEACRAHTDKAIKVLAECLDGTTPSIRMKAAEILLDRGWGRPTTPIELEGEINVNRRVEEMTREQLMRIIEEEKARKDGGK